MTLYSVGTWGSLQGAKRTGRESTIELFRLRRIEMCETSSVCTSR